MKNILKSMFAAGTLCFSGLLALTPMQSASALSPGMTPINQMLGDAAEQLPIENVAQRRGNRGGAKRGGRNRGGAKRGGANRNRARNRGVNRRAYNRHRHGRRYAHRRTGYRYRYGKYWYNNQWWLAGLGAAAIIGTGAAYAGGHCARISNLCAANWGSGGPDYWGCMRYEGCN